MHSMSTQWAQFKSSLFSVTFRQLKPDLKYHFNWNENACAGICITLVRHSQLCLWTMLNACRELFHDQNFHCLVQTFLLWLPFLTEVKQSQLSPLLFCLSPPIFERINKPCTCVWIIYYYIMLVGRISVALFHVKRWPIFPCPKFGMSFTAFYLGIKICDLD